MLKLVTEMDDYQQGVADGYSVGYKKAMQHLLSSLQDLKAARKPYGTILAQLEMDMIDGVNND